MTIKGWSVTLSLAALGFGFKEQSYALFALAAATGLAFWFIDVLMKRYQLRYYARMRDIERAMFELNRVRLSDGRLISAPRIDMTWPFSGKRKRVMEDQEGNKPNKPKKPKEWKEDDWRDEPPERRSPEKVRELLRRPLWMPQVAFPHVAAVLLGTALFIAALANVPGLSTMKP
jgi:hypothetical protein